MSSSSSSSSSSGSASASANIEHITIGSLPAIRLVNTDASGTIAIVEITLFGAHVTRWAEGKEEMLYMSKQAVLNGSSAIRGGIPVIFPQFGPYGNVGNHGFARTSVWTNAGSQTATSNGLATSAVTLTLTQSEKTKQKWPNNDFLCEYTVRLEGAKNSRLSCSWKIENLNHQQSFHFATALHTYFAVSDISQTVVTAGTDATLQGVSYVDQPNNRQIVTQQSPEIIINSEVDRIYMKAPSHMIVRDKAGRRDIHCVKSVTMPDAIVWNPWVEKAKALADFGDDDYKVMVCVEAANIGYNNPAQLAPGQSWQGSIQLCRTHHK